MGGRTGPLTLPNVSLMAVSFLPNSELKHLANCHLSSENMQTCDVALERSWGVLTPANVLRPNIRAVDISLTSH